ncbi:alpha/beta-hydrolase family protein [Mesorhizobium sp. B2-3-4]|uniref:alpha/beta hydrolase n=1 Tax=Mesorhizobium sp. B2-3-4 TaxID=2589959 RepID=UPI00112C2B82|nr:alpha/beta-hydrolase family protein [Mesorhizobium sp. B2-3-4]TPM35105.1 hypothetical protein FJ967_20680 [Mesorhizobium sp. B2-3-4]
MMRGWTIRLLHSFSLVGLLTGTLFFAASLTPSLNPRAALMQGVLSGLCLAVGYGIGVFSLWLWTYLELPMPAPGKARPVKRIAALICAAIALVFLWRASEWQNSIRTLMELKPVDSAQPLKIGLIALITFVLALMLARLFQITFRLVSGWLALFIPRRIAIVAGVSVAVLLFGSIINGVLLRYALHVADGSYQKLDALVEDKARQPADPAKTGSAASLIDWEHLGRTGREFVTTGPAKQDLQSFLKRDALEPIRVYAGLRSADTAEERARLALAELKRVGAFDRSILVIITPTGTGWIDPAAIDTLEYLRGGDVASVAIQYSYLPSWLSLMVEPGYGGDAARALFAEVYRYWTTLPRDHRPKLYLHGLSLGAMNSEQSNELFEVLGDPYQGALWSGPPYSSRIWRSITRNRNPGSPAWLPRFRDGSYVRFTNQNNALDIPNAHWGPMRIVYLQYASDAVTFFEPKSFYRRPDWMAQPRGPDVSADLRWYPIVTFLQLAVDMVAAATMPMGHGHVYAPEHYIDAWIEVTDVQGWTTDDIVRLKRHFAER